MLSVVSILIAVPYTGLFVIVQAISAGVFRSGREIACAGAAERPRGVLLPDGNECEVLKISGDLLDPL